MLFFRLFRIAWYWELALGVREKSYAIRSDGERTRELLESSKHLSALINYFVCVEFRELQWERHAELNWSELWVEWMCLLVAWHVVTIAAVQCLKQTDAENIMHHMHVDDLYSMTKPHCSIHFAMSPLTDKIPSYLRPTCHHEREMKWSSPFMSIEWRHYSFAQTLEWRREDT